MGWQRGFIDHVITTKADTVRVCLPPDTGTLLSVADHCLFSRNYVNVIIADRQSALNYLGTDEAIAHCTRGIGIWPWAGNTDGEPDVVLARGGDIPTLATLAAEPGGRGPALRRRVTAPHLVTLKEAEIRNGDCIDRDDGKV